VFEIVTGSRSGEKPSKKFKVNEEAVISGLLAVMELDTIDQFNERCNRVTVNQCSMFQNLLLAKIYQLSNQ
jgi:hypothetical protein